MKASEIKRILFKVFPKLEVPWCRDSDYGLPTIQQVKDFLEENDVNQYHFKEETFDCDDFALQLHAEVKRQYHWAFGECFGDKIKGVEKLHNLNFFIAADDRQGYLVEPQTDEIWKAEIGRDNILIIGM